MGDLNVKGQENQYGIDLLRKFIGESIELGITIDKQLEDGWQFTDLWAIVGEAKDLSFIWKQWTDIKNEFNDLTKEEIVELVNSVVGELGIDDEKIVKLVSDIINFAEATYNLVLSFKSLKK